VAQTPALYILTVNFEKFCNRRGLQWGRAEEVISGWRNLRKQNIRIFFITRYYSGDQRMRWVDYVALMKSETHTNFRSENLKRRDIEIGGIMILKWILKKKVLMM
jgi:hypothetical protein